MKKTLIYMFASAAMLAAGCSEDADYGTEYARLSIEGSVDATIETRANTAPAASDFSLTIEGSEGVQSWETVAAYNVKPPLFLEGAYTVSIAHGDPDAEGPDAAAYYFATKDISILRRTENHVALTAKIVNSQAVVRATAQFLQYFHDAEFTITTGSGNGFTFKPAAANDGEPVWVKAATTLKVNGTAKRQSQTGADDGLATTFREQTLDATKPGTCHIFTFDANNAGSVTLEITLGDSLTETRDVDSEMNDAAIVD